MKARISVRSASPEDLPQIRNLLMANKLPTKGIEKCVSDFVLGLNHDGSLAGVAGLETYGDSGLLRSVAVDEHLRGLGCGRTLVESVLRNARLKGVRTVYLLTDSATAYFKGLGFEVVDRTNIDQAVKASAEFTECCEAATAMRRATS